MKIEANSPEEYISKLNEPRKSAFSKLRNVINENLPTGFEETMSYGMIGYVVPHTVYSAGYHCNPKLPLPFINIASQKNFVALYHMGIYANKELMQWFLNDYPKHCSTKPDMGKSCIRFKKIEHIPYELIAALVAKMTCNDWISLYEKQLKS
ncbi:DUF1801 domain-containing protein [uncultured Draconibacterium sp.]|uniref:DUF1801 domain-containing protein n=1 Tax=uncultured Draconibacterium sp. TaxID=1573823 RepID=UPI0025ECE5BC|nr:DUF1801 domain-containing protein [uncultured Draconibacterium sp.]